MQPSEYAKLDDVKPGDFLIADGGFTCMTEGTAYKVKESSTGALYIECKKMRHLLDAQLNDEDRLVGLSLKDR